MLLLRFLLCAPQETCWPGKEVKAHYFWVDFCDNPAFEVSFLLDPKELFFMLSSLLRWNFFWRGANKHIWQDLVRHMIAVKSRLYSPLEFKLLCYCCYVWQIWLVWFFFVLSHILEIWEWELCWHWKLQKLNQASGKQMVSKCSFTPSYPLFFGMWEGGWVQGQKLHKTLIILRERRRSGVFLHWWCFLHQDP